MARQAERQRARQAWAGALLALATCAVVGLCWRTGSASFDVLVSRFADVQAVGDPCLGRSCPLGDKAAQRDLNSFFDSFLHRNGHAGHKPRADRHHDKTLKGIPLGLVQWHRREAAKDMDAFFDGLDSSKTASVQKWEEHAKPNKRLTAEADRKNLQRYYDSITPKEQGRRPEVLDEEERDEELAVEHHRAANEAAEKSEDKVERRHKQNELRAEQEHARYVAEEKQDRARQDAGHDKQAVPAGKLSAAESSKEQNAWFARLGAAVKKTHSVLAAEKRAGRSHDRMSLAEDQQKQQQYFHWLDTQVHKTPRVLDAERRAARGRRAMLAAKEKRRAALAGQLRAAVAMDGGLASDRLSGSSARKQQAAYFKALDSRVHKTAEVLRAEARGSRNGRTHRSRQDLLKAIGGVTTRPGPQRGTGASRSLILARIAKARVPKLAGKLALEWKGREPAGELYASLKARALATKGVGGSQRASGKEWADKTRNLVDKMEHEMNSFKI